MLLSDFVKFYTLFACYCLCLILHKNYLKYLNLHNVDYMQNKLLDIVGWTNNPEPIFLARERHIQALTYTGEHLKRADQFLLLDNPPLDLIAEELRLAHESLGEIIGVTTPDDILGLIFSRFCIGK